MLYDVLIYGVLFLALAFIGHLAVRDIKMRGSWGDVTVSDGVDTHPRLSDATRVPAGETDDIRLAQAPDLDQAIRAHVAHAEQQRAQERAKRKQRDAERRQLQREAEVRARVEAWLRAEPPTKTDKPWPGH